MKSKIMIMAAMLGVAATASAQTPAYRLDNVGVKMVNGSMRTGGHWATWAMTGRNMSKPHLLTLPPGQ